MKQIVSSTILLIGILSFPCTMLVRSIRIKSPWLFLLIPGIGTTLIAGGTNAEWVVWVFAATYAVSICIYFGGHGGAPLQKHYDMVAAELHGQTLQDGLWTRAFSEAGGDSTAARARYIQLRAADLAGGSQGNAPLIAGLIIGASAMVFVVITIASNSKTDLANSPTVATPPPSESLSVASTTPVPIPRFDPILPALPKLAPLITPAPITNIPENLPETRLDTGTVIDQAFLNGKGTLTVSNGSNRDALAKLIDRTARKRIAVFYVRRGGSFTLRDIPNGYYHLLFAMGTDFEEISESFRRNSAFSEFKEPFEYTTRVETRGSSMYEVTSQFSVTLHPVFDGKAKTGSISADEFNRY